MTIDRLDRYEELCQLPRPLTDDELAELRDLGQLVERGTWAPWATA